MYDLKGSRIQILLIVPFKMVTPIFFVAYLLTRPPVMVAGIPIENAYEIGVTGSNGGSLSLVFCTSILGKFKTILLLQKLNRE